MDGGIGMCREEKLSPIEIIVDLLFDRQINMIDSNARRWMKIRE